MPNDDESDLPLEQERLNEILMKVLTYQHSLPDGRAVALDELRRERVLSPEDFDFLSLNLVTYKPHRLNDHHAGDMFHMPTEGGCVFIGPCGPPLVKRRVPLNEFQGVVDAFLKMPKPKDELLLHVDFTENDGVGVSPGMISFNLQGADWRRMLPKIRAVASEFGLQSFQDEEVQGSWVLTFSIGDDDERIAEAVAALVSRGCGFADDREIIYSAGALDEE